MAARRPTGRQTSRATTRFERWFPMLDMVLLLLGVAVVISFTYLAWIIIRGDLGYNLIHGTQLEVIKSGLAAGQKALLTALWLLVILGLLRHYKNESLGYLTMAAGLACWVGMPMLIGKYSPATAAPTLQDAATELMAAFHSSGVALFVVGLMRIVLGRIVLMTYQPKGATVQRLSGMFGPEVPEIRGGRNSVMRKCWELHFCRGSVRTTCPRYIEGVACWRKRSGCYCDHDLASRLMSSVGGNQSVKLQVAEELETQQRRAQELKQRLARQQKGLPAARRLCRECPLYLEHQKFKYRALSWLVYPVTVLIIAASAGLIRTAYQWSDEHAAAFASQLNFIPQHLMDHPVEVAPWLNAENFFIGIIGVIVLAILLQITELAVFRFKL